MIIGLKEHTSSSKSLKTTYALSLSYEDFGKVHAFTHTLKSLNDYLDKYRCGGRTGLVGNEYLLLRELITR